MRSRRVLLLLSSLCACTALVGCAEVRGAANTPGRTQRPTAFYKTAGAPSAPASVDRPRALDEYMRGKRAVKPGPRTGGTSDNPVQTDLGSIAAPPSRTLDAAFDNTAPKSPGRTHRMQKGENLWAVARRYGVTVDEIVRANHLSDPEHLPAGTKLFIPGEVATVVPARRTTEEPEPIEPAHDEAPAPSEPGKGVYHVLVKGDSVKSLSRFYGVKPSVIEQWNAKEIAQGLPAGSTVYIPGAKPGGKRLLPAPEEGAKPQKVASFRPRPEPAGFQWPVQGTVISKFGMRNGRPHTGLDIGADEGVPVHAAMAGKVIFSGTMNGYGNVVILDHQNGYFSVYGHNQKNLVKVDREGTPRILKAGDVIALCGQTGNASRPHVHFEIRRSNDALDPLTLLKSPPPTMASKPIRGNHGE